MEINLKEKKLSRMGGMRDIKRHGDFGEMVGF